MQLFDSAVLKPPAPGAHDWSVHETGEVGSGRLTATATGPGAAAGARGRVTPSGLPPEGAVGAAFSRGRTLAAGRRVPTTFVQKYTVRARLRMANPLEDAADELEAEIDIWRGARKDARALAFGRLFTTGRLPVPLEWVDEVDQRLVASGSKMAGLLGRGMIEQHGYTVHADKSGQLWVYGPKACPEGEPPLPRGGDPGRCCLGRGGWRRRVYWVRRRDISGRGEQGSQGAPRVCGLAGPRPPDRHLGAVPGRARLSGWEDSPS